MTDHKSCSGNFFEDFALGQRFGCTTPRWMGGGERALYISMTGDRTPGFCDETQRIHPLQVFHQVLGQTVRDVSLNAIANLGYSDIRWHDDVGIGDTITTECEVIGLKENSNQRSGIVWVRTLGYDQEGRCLMSFVRWVMVRKRARVMTPWLDTPERPSLPEQVDRAWLKERVVQCEQTQGRSQRDLFFEDYVVGEQIDHVDGHTVNPSEHMGFTRLFQNSARVHFDALHTEGRPLVFGGFAMSVGYAQALNGLDNRLGLIGMNSGAHPNPVYAGDTLFSATEVLDLDALGPESAVGLIRCRLRVVKNKRALSSVAEPQDVVLDMDYWEQMPKRSAVVDPGGSTVG
jgi:2-methylfumaryl-CoA hydratase